MVSFLLEHGADPNARGRDGITPLQLAVCLKPKFALRTTFALLRHGADPTRKDGFGKTPLQNAKEYGDGDRSGLVRLLRSAMAEK